MSDSDFEPIDVLDWGYVRLIEDWGHGEAGESEAGIIEAARQSTQGSFRGWASDEKLLAFLFNSNPPHATPFEFAGMIIEVQAPIFVFREWHRHRTQSYNEMSARYAPLPNISYVPEVIDTWARAKAAAESKNRQASTASLYVPDLNDVGEWVANVNGFYKMAENLYQGALDGGIPKELARIILPVGRYSKMRASANLRNWLAFLTLRMDPGAQWEIQQYAQAVGRIVACRFPHVWKLFEEKRNVGNS